MPKHSLNVVVWLKEQEARTCEQSGGETIKLFLYGSHRQILDVIWILSHALSIIRGCSMEEVLKSCKSQRQIVEWKKFEPSSLDL